VLFPAVACDGVTPIPIGVIAHEIGHAFGLPELYDTSKSPQSEGIGNWDLMAGGAWGGDGDSPEQPVQMSAWSKGYLGWVDPEDVTADQTGITLQPYETSGKVLLVTINRDISKGINEYYLISNRQRIGFDAKIPAIGLLVLHVNEAVLKDGIPNNNVNVDPASLGVAVVEADGLDQLIHHPGGGVFRGGPGDTFPGSQNKTAFDNSTTPRTTASLAMCSISSTANVITLDLLLSRGVCGQHAQGIAPAVSIRMLSEAPQSYSNIEVRVSGTLRNEVRNYFRDPPNLTLSDEQGYKVHVAPWARLEAPPLQHGTGPPVVSQYLNHQVELTGALTQVQDAVPWIFHVHYAKILR